MTKLHVSLDDIDFDFMKRFTDELRRSKQFPCRTVKIEAIPLKLANEIIDAGLRSLALKKHPDHGGTQEEMQALNAAAAWLRLAVQSSSNRRAGVNSAAA